MNYLKNYISIFIFIYFINTLFSFAQQKTGTIIGKIIDASNGDELAFASVSVKGKTIGVITDVNGSYKFDIEPGFYTLLFSYLGYKKTEKQVTLKVNETVTVNVRLEAENQLDEIVVTTQVKGQIAAIREQVSSNKIVNLVSAEKMQELPDANTAEALGRLPGISLQRSSGEAEKIIIRGLSPENNNVTIAGVKLASNNATDRSVDLSMMQNEMFAGAEVSKTLRPDMDAGAIGGTVDLRLAKAGKKNTFNAMYEGGYNNLFSELGDNKFTSGGSARFFKEKLGVIFQGSYENKLVSSQNFNGIYSDPEETTKPGDEGRSFIARTNGAHMSLNNSVRTRISGSLNLDFRGDFFDISFLNLINFNPDNSTVREEVYRFTESTKPFNLTASRNNNEKYTSTHLLENNFRFLNTDLSLKLSYSNSKSTNILNQFPFQEIDLSGEYIANDFLIFKNPKDVLKVYGGTEVLNNRLKTTNFENQEVIDDNYSLDLKWKLDNVLTIGGLYTRKVRSSDISSRYAQFEAGSGQAVRSVLLEKFPWIEWPVGEFDGIPASNFVDSNYNPGKFLNGEFDLTWSPDIDLMIDMQSKFLEESPDLFYFNGINSYRNKYESKEKLLALYTMFEFNIGKLSLVSGVRFEQMNTLYSSFSILTNSINSSGTAGEPVPISAERENKHFFPSINMKWKLNETLAFRGAVYKSISRPNFSNLSPSIIVDSDQSKVLYYSNNPLLLPSVAWNYDLSFEAYSSKFGLLTINPFYKIIEGMQIGLSNYFPLRNEMITNSPSGLIESIPDVNSYPSGWLTRTSNTTIPINNPEKSELRGLEISFQTNLRFLNNNILKGFVFDVNLTFIDSKTKNPFFKEIIDRSGFIPRVVGYEYNTRDAKIASQPDFISNFIIGYDFKGFSSRISYRRQGSTVLDSAGEQLTFRQNYKRDLELIDISLRQKFMKNFEIFVNATNISNYVDERYAVFNNEHRLPLNLNYFGNRIKFGLRYRL